MRLAVSNDIQRKTKKKAEQMIESALITKIHLQNMFRVEFYACNLILLQIQDDVLNSNVEPA